MATIFLAEPWRTSKLRHGLASRCRPILKRRKVPLFVLSSVEASLMKKKKMDFDDDVPVGAAEERQVVEHQKAERRVLQRPQAIRCLPPSWVPPRVPSRSYGVCTWYKKIQPSRLPDVIGSALGSGRFVLEHKDRRDVFVHLYTPQWRFKVVNTSGSPVPPPLFNRITVLTPDHISPDTRHWVENPRFPLFGEPFVICIPMIRVMVKPAWSTDGYLLIDRVFLIQ